MEEEKASGEISDRERERDLKMNDSNMRHTYINQRLSRGMVWWLI